MFISNLSNLKLTSQLLIGICALLVSVGGSLAPVQISAQEAVSPVTAINEEAAKTDIELVCSLLGNGFYSDNGLYN